MGTAQSPASNQQPQPLRQDVDYEISAAAFPSTPASAPGWYSWLFTFFQSLTLFPSHPLCVHRSSSRLAACVFLFRSYSDDGCRRKQAVYLVNLVSLISFVIWTCFFFFQLNLHQLSRYKKKNTSFRNNPLPHHLPHDLPNHNHNHQCQTPLLTYHLRGLLKLSQLPHPHSNKMTSTKLLIVPRLPRQSYRNRQHRLEKRKIMKYRVNHRHHPQSPLDLPKYLNHRSHGHQMFHKMRHVSCIIVKSLSYIYQAYTKSTREASRKTKYSTYSMYPNLENVSLPKKALSCGSNSFEPTIGWYRKNAFIATFFGQPRSHICYWSHVCSEIRW